jgi:probable HAF family extracellular repeat protein
MKTRLSLVLAISLLSINWTIRDLGTLPGGRSSFATKINNSGEIVGASVNAAGDQRAVLFDPVVEIPTATGFPGSVANDINDNKIVVGQSPAGGWFYSIGSGSVTLLGPRTGAYAISQFNDIGGYEWFTASNHRGYIWLGLSPTPFNIGFMGTGNSTTVRDVAHGKAAAGWARYKKADSHHHAFLWFDRAMIDLGTLGGSSSGADALVVNDWPDPYMFSTHVVGQAETASGQLHAFRWNAGTMTDLGTLPGHVQSRALDINKFKVAVGTSTDSAGSQIAVMWDGGTIIDLNTLVPPAEHWTLTIAFGINDHGQIVGGGLHDGLPRAFVLTP